MRGKGSAAGRDALLLAALSALTQLLGFLYRVGLSRLVGAQVMGLYHLLMPVYSALLSAAGVGVTAAVSNLSARHQAVGSGLAVGQTLRSGLQLFLTVMLPLTAVTAALYDPISVYFLGDARTQLGLLLLLPCAVLTGVENVHKHFFYGLGQVRPPALVELGEQVIRAGAVLGLLTAFLPQNPERTVGLIALGMIVCEIFSSVTLTLLGRRRLKKLRGGAEEPPDRLRRRMLSIAVPVGCNALIGNLMGAVNAAVIPRCLVRGGMTRRRAMAEFGVLCGMTMPMLGLPCIFLGALHLIVMPRIARSSALGDGARLRRDVERALGIVWAAVLPCMALTCVTGGELGQLLFKEARVGQYLVPLALSTLCGALASILSGAVGAAGHQKVNAGISITCDAVQLGLTVLCMGALGMDMGGFVAGVTVSSVLGLVLSTLAARRYLGFSLHPGRRGLICAVAALFGAQTAALLRACLLRAGLPAAAVACGTLGFGGVAYLAALAAMGLRGETREK